MKNQRLIWLGLLIPLVVGCVQNAVREKAQAVAAAGAELSAAIPAALDEEYLLEVDASSVALLQQQKSLPSGFDGIKQIRVHDGELLRRRSNLDLLGQHADQLSRYFRALGRLSASSTPPAAGDSTANLMGEINKLTKMLAIDFAVPDFAAQVAEFVVGAIQVAAIRNELEEHGKAIAEAIALQEAALQSLRQDTIILQKQIADYSTERLVVRPLQAKSEPPWDWIQRRRGQFVPVDKACN